jgi:sugar phosphate isomerase/epimerase
MNEMTTYRWSFEEDVLNYRDAGFSAMGVWRRKLADYGIERAIELLEREQFHVSNLLWAGGFTGSNGQSYQNCLADGVRTLRLAGQLKADSLIVYSGARNGHTQNHVKRLFAGALRHLAPIAEELQVTLAVEPMHPGCASEWTYLTTMDDTLALIDAVGSPAVKIAFDTYHLGHDPQLIERLGSLVPHIGIVHLGDCGSAPTCEQDRQQLGDGCLPLRQIVQALDSAGYRGYYDIELHGQAIENVCYKKILARSRETFETLAAC